MAIVCEWQLPPGAPVTYLAAPVGETIAYLRNPDGVVGTLELGSGAVTEWTIPPALLDGAPAILTGIAPLRRGYAFALQGRPALGLFDPAAGEFRLLHTPISVAGAPQGLAVDAVGHVWASVSGPASMWRLEPWSAHGIVWPLPTELGSPCAVAAALTAGWFSFVDARPGPLVGCLELRASRITLYELAGKGSREGRGVAVGSHGEVWVASSGLYRLSSVPRPSATLCAERADRVSVDESGSAWFTAPGRIGHARSVAGVRVAVDAETRPLEAEGFEFAVTAERAEPAASQTPPLEARVGETETDGVVDYPLPAPGAAPFDVVAAPRRVVYSDSARDVIGALA